MTMTRESWTNLSLADSYDLWPFDDHRGDGGGWLVIVFRDSFSSVISNELGPMVWKTEHAAQVFMGAMDDNLQRHPCELGPRQD